MRYMLMLTVNVNYEISMLMLTVNVNYEYIC